MFEFNFRDISMLHQCNIFKQFISLKYQSEKMIHNHIIVFNKLYQKIKIFDHFKDFLDMIWVTRFLWSLSLKYINFARFYDKKLIITKLNDIYEYFYSEFNNHLLISIKKFTSSVALINYTFNNSFIKKLKK